MKRTIALLLLAAMLLSLTACVGKSPEETKPEDAGNTVGDASYTVGIVQLIQHVALDAATQGFKDALTEKLGDKVTFDEQNASGDPATCSVIANQFVSSKVDLIMANATTALQAALTATSSIPILGTSVTDYGTALGMDNWTGTTGSNISGTSDLAPLDQQAEIIQELFPDAKNIGILYCSAEPNSKYQFDVISGYLTDMGYSCKAYTFSDSNDLQTVATTMAQEADMVYLPTDNTVASNTEIIKNVCVPAGIPIVAGEEGICKGCGVATLSISYYDLGYATGLMAYEILVNNADPATMDIQFAPSFTKLYNAEIAETLNVSIPEGYTAITAE